jgi:hypothetical protein
MRSGCSDTTASLSTHKCEDLTSVSVFFLSLACSLLVCCDENQLCLCRFLLGRQRDLVTQTFQAMHQVSREVVLVELF